MSARSRFLLVTVAIVFSAAIALVCYNRPYLRSARIIEGNGAAETSFYAQEFAASLRETTIRNHFQLSPISGEATSPDGKFTLHQRPLRNAYHAITLSRGVDGETETVLILQEGDPGSGTSHDYQWSRDSKAVFICGSGTPAGHAHTNKLALIYVVDRRTLYSIDLEPLLLRRNRSGALFCPDSCVSTMAVGGAPLGLEWSGLCKWA